MAQLLSDEQILALAPQKKFLSDEEALALPARELSLSDAAMQATGNVGKSAMNFASNMIQPIIHPIETGKAVGKTVVGGVQKLIPGQQEYEPYADALGGFFADRYGGWENFKRTMAEDPVGFAADLSVVLGGGGLAARLPGVAGQVGKVAATASRAVDPLTPVAKLAKGAGYVGSEILGGLGTHTGGQSIRTAANAGLQGGAKADAFKESLRGNLPMEDVVTEAKGALSNIRQQRGADYRAGMAGVTANTRVLPFAPIDNAVNQAAAVKNFKGVNISPSTGAVWKEIADTVDEWRALDPADYHTIEGFDALKQKIGDIKDSKPYGTTERLVAEKVYNAVRGEITKADPKYALVMREYEKASDLIKEMEKTLSLNPKASIDTSLRKLQSVMRNNANTNYGKRLDLAEILVKSGAPNLMERLAGQTLNTWTPRGLGKIVAGGTVAAPLAVTQSLMSLLDPTVIAVLASQSPRLIGEVAFAGGRAAALLSKAKPRALTSGSFQAGRLEDQVQR